MDSRILRLPRYVRLTLQVVAHTCFEGERRVVLQEESAWQILYHGAIEEDVSSFLLTYVTAAMTFIDVGTNISNFSPFGC
jgi:hypothetical protein